MTANPGPELGPDEPVGGAKKENGNTDNGENVVGVALGVPVSNGRDEGNDSQEDVEEEEDNEDRFPAAPRGLPGVSPEEVEEDETAGNEAVDPDAGVGVEVDQEVVGRSGRRSKQDDNGNQPVQKEGSGRSIARLVGTPEPAKRKQTLLAQLLVETSMGESDSQNVAQVAESDENGKGLDTGVVTENVLEKDTGDKNFGGSDIGLGDSGEVGDVGQDVEDSDTGHGDRSGESQGTARILEFAHNVVGVFPTLVTVDNVEQGVGVSISAATTVILGRLNAESVIEVLGVGDVAVTGKGGETSEDDEKDNDDLEDTKDIDQADTPLRKKGVQGAGKSSASNTNTAGLVAVLGLSVVGVKDVAAKGERVSGRETEEDHLRGENAGSEVLWVLVDVLEVVLLTTRARNGKTEFEPYTETAAGQEATCVGIWLGRSGPWKIPDYRAETRFVGGSNLPITQRKILTPTEPVAWKIAEGVEKIPVPIILLRIKKTAPVIPILRSSL